MSIVLDMALSDIGRARGALSRIRRKGLDA
jgi:hypothetical protein